MTQERVKSRSLPSLISCQQHFNDKLVVKNENSITPESSLSFVSTVALEKQLRSLLCAYFHALKLNKQSLIFNLRTHI